MSKRFILIMLLAVCTLPTLAQEKAKKPAAQQPPAFPMRHYVEPKNVKHPPISDYFTPAMATPMTPDAQGFIRRWLLLEPFKKPNRSNTVFVESYLREHLTPKQYPGVDAGLPRDGQKVTVKTAEGKQRVTWHAMDSKNYNVRLFRFASGLNKTKYGVLFWGVTVVNAPEDMRDVRLAAGSNGASRWWLNGEEVLLLDGDRRMVVDDGMSRRINLKKGPNILRVGLINGPGLSDLCVRFLDAKGNPITNLTITTE